jgi:hypothetical protein
VKQQRKVSTWTRKITLVHDGDSVADEILFSYYAILLLMHADRLEALDLRRVLVTNGILAMVGTTSSVSLRDLAFQSPPAVVLSSVGKLLNLRYLIITITRPASAWYNAHWAALAQMPAWDLPRLQRLNVDLNFVPEDHQGVSLAPFLARCRFEMLRRLATRILGPVWESDVALRTLTSLFDRHNALDYCHIQAESKVLTHILAHVACSYLKLLLVPSAHGVATLHPAVRTLCVVPSHGVTRDL